MLVARAKKEAIAQVDAGNPEEASRILQNAHNQVLAAPPSPLLAEEAQALLDLDQDLKARRLQEFRKSSHYQSHSYQTSSGQGEYEEYQTKRKERHSKSNKS